MEALGSFRTNSSVRVEDRTFIIERRLGNGAFGVVYKVKEESSHGAYALKEVLCLDKSEIDNALREIETMRRISHENVIAIKGSAKIRDNQGLHILILTEYCSGGNLNERLTRWSSEELNFKWIRQTAGALAFLHSRNVVHRDLKADNVLLTATEDAKLADFGLAREFMSVKRYPNFSVEYYMSSGVGPRHWVAPEFFRGHYTEKADVFSLGTLFYGILERDYIKSCGKAYYGAFKNIPDVGKVGLGEAMARYDPNISIRFSSGAQGSYALQRIALNAMQYSMNDRPSASKIHDQIVIIGHQNLCQRILSNKDSSLPQQYNFSPHPLNEPNFFYPPFCQTPDTFCPPFCQTPDTFCPPLRQTPDTFCPPFCQTPDTFCPPFCQTPDTFSSPLRQTPDTFSSPLCQTPDTFSSPLCQTPDTFSSPLHQTPDTFSSPLRQTPDTFSSPLCQTPDTFSSLYTKFSILFILLCVSLKIFLVLLCVGLLIFLVYLFVKLLTRSLSRSN